MTSVRVYCRVRPFNSREDALGHCDSIVKVGKQVITVRDKAHKDKVYHFDHNFDMCTTQTDLFQIIGHQIVDDFMAGFNATQFVYGQTGAGKSWTMMGVRDSSTNCGVIPRSAALIFQRISEREEGWKFGIVASYLEIFMERVNDLLDPNKQNLDIKESKTQGVFVSGLSTEDVSSLEDVFDILERGDKIRKVAATKMNSGSSRSHSVLSLYLEQTSPDGETRTSQLNLVDLAGSERLDKTGATGDVMKQGTLINLSLTVLSQVISGLSKQAEGKSGMIPYRDSKLTRLLQASLGGNAKTGLSLHISPHLDNIEESISTLEFGKRAKMIKNNAVCRITKSCEQLERELEALQRQFDELKTQFLQKSSESVLTAVLEGNTAALAGAMAVAFKDTAGAMEAELEKYAASATDTTSLEDAARQKLEAKKELADKTVELEKGSMELKEINETLRSRVTALSEKLIRKEEEREEVGKDYEIVEMEIETLHAQMKEHYVKQGDLEQSKTSERLSAEEERARAEKRAKEKFESSSTELNSLIKKQRNMIKRTRVENDQLKQDNTELTQQVGDKTRRLALSEIKLMRYDLIKSMIKDKPKGLGRAFSKTSIGRTSSQESNGPPSLSKSMLKSSQSVGAGLVRRVSKGAGSLLQSAGSMREQRAREVERLQGTDQLAVPENGMMVSLSEKLEDSEDEEGGDENSNRMNLARVPPPDLTGRSMASSKPASGRASGFGSTRKLRSPRLSFGNILSVPGLSTKSDALTEKTSSRMSIGSFFKKSGRAQPE